MTQKQVNVQKQNGNCAKPLLANRLLKFRAWDEKQKYMAIQGTLDLETLQSFMFHFGEDFLMQFTGFYDFDNKEIYEGDILKYVSFRREESKRLEIVQFDINCGGWYVHKSADTLANLLFCQHSDEWKSKQGFSINENQRVIIVGNIFENPELFIKSN